MEKDNLTSFTKDNFDNIENIQLIKFKGRKATNFKSIDTFNPEDYVVIFKDDDSYYSIITVNDKQYKILYDSNLTILDQTFFKENILNNNETFFIKPIDIKSKRG